MKTFKLLILLVLLNSCASFGQAILHGSTLTVTDLSGSYIYYQHNISLVGELISSTGPGAPLNTAISIKITSSGTRIKPYFTIADLNGSCDTYLIGSMNSTNTQFTTTLNSCCSSVAEGFANGIRFRIPIKCANVGGSTETDCIMYNISTSCNLYCISFFLPSNMAACRKKNYTAIINFTDGTSSTIIGNFAAKNTVFCFPKPISRLASSNFSNCNYGVSPNY